MSDKKTTRELFYRFNYVISFIIKLRWLFILTLVSCSNNGSTSTKYAEQQANEQFAIERQRIEAERKQEREVLANELSARNLTSKTNPAAMWKQFRSVYPYHNQTIALSTTDTDGSRTLIVSEPPPNVTTTDILLPLAKILLNHSIQKQTIGYDGWVKDIAIAIKGSDQEIASALSALNLQLFGTSYKAYVIPLPAQQPVKSNQNLDIQVTANELKTWVIDENISFTPLESGKNLTASDVFNQTSCNIYHANVIGIVGWWIPKGNTVEDCRIQAREFSLDADLVVGALSKNDGIFVLGRERIVPLDILPPLRVQTLSLLGSVQNGQEGKLAQSYERTYEYAGMTDDKDWAPIYLSPELIDTEYGSLLNITDQLLKGWSNNGQTTYANFDYPRPPRMPFKDPLPKILNTRELTYNWNTRGAGYTVDAGDYQIMALNRTGALPVSYFIDEAKADEAPANVLSAMDNGYNYFAGINDPNLVRVVQYAAMYQIFSAFNIAKSKTVISPNAEPENTLHSMISNLEDEVYNLDSSQQKKLALQISPIVSRGEAADINYMVNEAVKKIAGNYAAQLRELGIEPGSERYNFIMNQELGKARSQIRVKANALMAADRQEMLATVTDTLSTLRSSSSLSENDISSLFENDSDDATLKAEENKQLRQEVKSVLAGIKEIPQQYSAEMAEKADRENNWIHTPVVVMSKNTGLIGEFVGGHNLDARVSKFIYSDEVTLGRTRITPEGDIMINPQDAAKVKDIVRDTGLNYENLSGIQSRLERTLAEAGNIVPRPSSVALNLPERLSATENASFNFLSSSTIGETSNSRSMTGWGRFRSGTKLTEPELSILQQDNQLIDGSLSIIRSDDGSYKILTSGSDNPIIAFNNEDATDSVVSLLRRNSTGGGPLKLSLHGFESDNAATFVRSCEVHAANEKVPGEIDAFIRENLAGSNIEHLKSAKYDFSKLEYTISDNIEITSAGLQKGRIQIEIPSLETGNITGKSVIEATFSKSTPPGIIRSFLQRIAKAIEELKSRFSDNFDSILFHRALNQEIKRISIETGVDVKSIRMEFKHEKGDIYFAEVADTAAVEKYA